MCHYHANYLSSSNPKEALCWCKSNIWLDRQSFIHCPLGKSVSAWTIGQNYFHVIVVIKKPSRLVEPKSIVMSQHLEERFITRTITNLKLYLQYSIFYWPELFKWNLFRSSVLFGHPKKTLKGCRFWCSGDNRAVMVQWFKQESRKVFVKWMAQLVHQWDNCLYAPGNCF